ncbi:hypothetical protein BT96DRAFT_1025482 [Gymnopus androsaceus JB14]|uniref:Uncharacterized protein n=1 Tax=Gymnopus androsaceus JB14 TaxID=1447944 RepID=A0A6A4GTE0_9AGAR|nr:hypothetical protein BT96DRAFT_1025482 [Gymnopus androsaceus JB14]
MEGGVTSVDGLDGEADIDLPFRVPGTRRVALHRPSTRMIRAASSINPPSQSFRSLVNHYRSELSASIRSEEPNGVWYVELLGSSSCLHYHLHRLQQLQLYSLSHLHLDSMVIQRHRSSTRLILLFLAKRRSRTLAPVLTHTLLKLRTSSTPVPELFEYYVRYTLL